MKILILYTPRSGSNSIASYFLKQNTHYEYFNQPFSELEEVGVRHSSYQNCLKYDNLLVKSDIVNFTLLKINKEQVLRDFDKVLLISRKNKREQAISFMIAAELNNYLDNSKRSYFTEGLKKQDIEYAIKESEWWHTLLEKYIDVKIPFFYYEDLYYDNFNALFEYLQIEYVENDYKSILDIKNKYKTKDLKKKKINTLL